MEIRLRLKYRQGHKGRYKPKTSNGGVSKHRGETDKNRMAFAQAQTKKYQRIMIRLPTGKRVFVLASSLAT
jgi:hypothetical protein